MSNKVLFTIFLPEATVRKKPVKPTKAFKNKKQYSRKQKHKKEAWCESAWPFLAMQVTCYSQPCIAPGISRPYTSNNYQLGTVLPKSRGMDQKTFIKLARCINTYSIIDRQGC